MAASRAPVSVPVALLAVLAGALAGCLAGGDGRDLPSPGPVVTSESGTSSAATEAPTGTPAPTNGSLDAPLVRFVVVGDTGTGEFEEYQVADAIGRVCRARGCGFIVHTGDILYDDGPETVDDSEFEVKYERPYGALGLPVYLVLGNHDVGGNPESGSDLEEWRVTGDLNVAYSGREDRTSDTWRMPARWHAFQQGPLAFAALDTTAFVFAGYEEDPAGPIHEAARQQEEWIQSAWPGNATWRFAVGHHPYRSNGMHGDAGDYGGKPELDGVALEAFYAEHVCGKVDFLLTGHDHDLQLLAPQACGGTHLLVSGAGARPRSLEDPQRNPALFQRGDTLGFWWLEAEGDRLKAIAYDGDGTVLFVARLSRQALAPA